MVLKTRSPLFRGSQAFQGQPKGCGYLDYSLKTGVFDVAGLYLRKQSVGHSRAFLKLAQGPAPKLTGECNQFTEFHVRCVALLEIICKPLLDKSIEEDLFMGRTGGLPYMRPAMWNEENARRMIGKIAAIKLWRDTYPDAQSDRLVADPIELVFSPEEVRLARALLEAR